MLTTLAERPVAERLLTDRAVAVVYRRMNELNLSASEVARRAGISRSTLSRLLSRERGTQVHTLGKIADALGMSAADLVSPGTLRRALDREIDATAAPPMPGGGPTPSYAVAIPVVAVANAGRGGGSVEEWAFMPFEDTQGRSLRAYRASGVCMEPHVGDGDTVIVDTEASPQEGQIVAAFNLDTGDFLIKWYSRRNGTVELRPEQGEPIVLAADRVRIEGVVIQVNRKAPRRRK